MVHLLLLTNALAPSAEVLPALGLLTHQVRILPAEPTALVDAPAGDVVLLDARSRPRAGPVAVPGAARHRAVRAR